MNREKKKGDLWRGRKRNGKFRPKKNQLLGASSFLECMGRVQKGGGGS